MTTTFERSTRWYDSVDTADKPDFLRLLEQPKACTMLSNVSQSLADLLQSVRKRNPALENSASIQKIFLIDFDVLQDFLSAKGPSSARSLAVDSFFFKDAAPFAIPLGAFLELLDWLNGVDFDIEIAYRNYTAEQVATVLKERLSRRSAARLPEGEFDWLDQSLPNPLVMIHRLLFILKNDSGRFLGVFSDYSSESSSELLQFVRHMPRPPREHSRMQTDRSQRDTRDAINLAIAFNGRGIQQGGTVRRLMLLTNTRPLSDLIKNTLEDGTVRYNALMETFGRVSGLGENFSDVDYPVTSPRQLWAWRIIRDRSTTAGEAVSLARDFENHFRRLNDDLVALQTQNEQGSTEYARALSGASNGIVSIAGLMRSSESPLTALLDSTLTDLSLSFNGRLVPVQQELGPDSPVWDTRVLDLARAFKEVAIRLEEIDSALVHIHQEVVEPCTLFSLSYGRARSMDFDLADGELYPSGLFVIRWPVTCVAFHFLFSVRRALRIRVQRSSMPRFGRVNLDGQSIQDQDGVYAYTSRGLWRTSLDFLGRSHFWRNVAGAISLDASHTLQESARGDVRPAAPLEILTIRVNSGSDTLAFDLVPTESTSPRFMTVMTAKPRVPQIVALMRATSANPVVGKGCERRLQDFLRLSYNSSDSQ